MTAIITRNDKAVNWTAADPTLKRAEIGYEYDTGKYKVGDGETRWTKLGYANGYLESVNACLAADVDIDTPDTFVDGPSVTLPAGTHLVSASITIRG